MVNRIVKTMRDPDDDFYMVIPATEGIIKFLKQNPHSGFGDIREHLKEHGANYSKMGLSLLLKKMFEKGDIEKDYIKSSRPTYYIRKRRWKDTDFQAETFEREARRRMAVQLIGPCITKEDRKWLKTTIAQVGLYYLFTYLKSWEYIKYNPDTKEDEDRAIWLKNALPLKGFTTLMDNNLNSMLSDKLRRVQYKQSMKLRKQKIHSLEKELIELFPETKELEEAWSELPKLAKEEDKFRGISANLDWD